MSLVAYQRARTITESPRATEARLMREITGEMIAARDSGKSGMLMMPVLFRNRTVWNAFADACSTRGNALPDGLRASIISIGLWVDRYTTEVATGRDSIDPLIEVNRAIIEGLEGSG